MLKCGRAALALAGLLAAAPVAASPVAEDYRARTPEQEIVYFVLPDRFENGDPANDRGGLAGGRLETGYDPTATGFYHGGDLKGLTRRLDYIQGLGATAIWLGPIYRNKPVQGPPGHESAGYHGYWITDFTDVDPHFGTRAELKAFVDAAHARGLKVYLDIITNHTADVIKYRECPANDCAYRSIADYPFTRRGGLGGAPINPGFEGIGPGHQDAANFARLTRPDYAYTPYVPPAEAHAKKPDWLNEPIYYHNRGDSTFQGESSLLGDFAGLDDVATENPRVVAGFIEIYGRWIDEFGIDGFRVDTARHVNPEFWQAFVPAMLARAKARGIPNFHIFGEVFDPDPAALAVHTRVDGFPAVLDFAFAFAAVEAVAKGGGTDRLARVYAADPLYARGEAGARTLPTFIGNHDAGRFAFFVRQANPKASDGEVLKRVLLGHALMMFGRGTPVIYYGDEQGFAGHGGDQAARQDMFASRVATYNDEALVGSTRTTATASFDTTAALYRAIAEMAAIRKADPALASGPLVVRAAGDRPGLFAYSRLGGGETLVAFNTSTAPVTAQVAVEARSARWRGLHGACAASASAPGSYRVEIAPLDYVLCKADAR
ncbi:MAG: alpha-amylase [Alphaproteobacteria bacterium]|nr:alpha-amylase [Alphaproteobacteria bacterium]